MDLGPYQLPTRVVGFTFHSNSSAESTLNACGASPAAKLHTQRSLLSELLAAQVLTGDDEEEEPGSYSDETDTDEDEEGAGPVLRAPLTRQGTYEQLPPSISEPIAIPCSGSVANQRVKDAYRRLLYQRQVEQLYQQQQIRLAQQRAAQAQQPYPQQQQQQQLQQQQASRVTQGRVVPEELRRHGAGVRAF